MPPIQTHPGDDGTTGLLGKGRLPKHHPRVEALGVLDEASAALGLARAHSSLTQVGDLLKAMQRDLYIIMTEVAATPKNAQQFKTIGVERVEWLAAQVDAVSLAVSLPADFVLPGDSLAGAAIALARTVIRRAERRVTGLFDEGEIGNKLILQYLNRASTLCFVLELLENAQAGKTSSLAKEQ